MKRVAIFVFYDADGVVDEYVCYLLRNLKPNVAYLQVVCNGYVTEEGQKKLKELSDAILIRPNKGFDAWAYKEGIENLGYDQIAGYDELILLNDTCFGPIYPFEQMFSVMDERQIDFWGMTQHHGEKIKKLGTLDIQEIPTHIQSYWLVIRKKVLGSEAFREYWTNLRKIKNYFEAVAFNEIIFTDFFASRGFKWSVYINTEPYKVVCPNAFIQKGLELIRDQKAIFVKRRTFTDDYLPLLENTASSIFKYLKDTTEYDSDLILNYLLRVSDLETIKNRLELYYFLPLGKDLLTDKNYSGRYCVIIELSFFEQVDLFLSYVAELPDEFDIYVIDVVGNSNQISSELAIRDKKKKPSRIKILQEKSILEISGIIEKYDGVCLLQDDEEFNQRPTMHREAFLRYNLESVLGTPSYVSQLLCKWEQEVWCGMLFPPVPSEFVMRNYWKEYEVDAIVVLKALGITQRFKNHPVISMGKMCWVRSEVLLGLIGLLQKRTDLLSEHPKKSKILNYILPLVSQSKNYYVACIFPDNVAKKEFISKSYMLESLSECHEGKGYYHFLRKSQTNAWSKIKSAVQKL